jgi:hypothetical protein
MNLSPVEAAPAVIVSPAPLVKEETLAPGMMAVAFDLYKLAAILGLSISRNEKASTEESKKMYKHWSKVGVDSTKSQGTSALAIAAAAFAIPLLAKTGQIYMSVPENQQKINDPLFQKIGDLTPQFLSPWTQGQAAAGQEASGKAQLLQSDLANGPQTASQYRSNVEESSKNLAQNIFQLVASAAKNGG